MIDTESVSRETWDKADALAKLFVEETVNTVAGQFDDCYGHVQIEPVESQSRDGFIAYTDGGWDGVAYAELSYAHGSGHVPAAVKPAIESSLDDAAEAFAEENGITVEEMNQWEADESARLAMPALPGMEPADTFVNHPLREALWEQQDDWLREGGTYFYKCRVMFYDAANSRNDSDVPMVRLFAYLNTDYEYGRDHIPWMSAYGRPADQTVDAYHVEMPLADFAALSEERIEEMAAEAVALLGGL